MATVITAHGNLDAKLPVMLQGELFVDYSKNSNGFKDLHYCVKSAEKGVESTEGVSAKTIILGSEQSLKFRGVASSLESIKPELFGVWQYINETTKVIPATDTHPKIISGDFIVCVSIDSSNVPSYVKLSGSGGEAQDLTVVDTKHNYEDYNGNGVVDVQDFLVGLYNDHTNVVVASETKLQYTDLDEFVKTNGITDRDEKVIVRIPQDIVIETTPYYGNSLLLVKRTAQEAQNDGSGLTLKPTGYTVQVLYTPKADWERLELSDTHARANDEATELYSESDKALVHTKEHIENLYKAKADVGPDGKLLVSQLPNTVLGGMTFNGVVELNLDELKQGDSLASYLPSTDKYGNPVDDGDYWVVNVTRNPVDEDQPLNDDPETEPDSTMSFRAVDANGKEVILHSGDYLVAQVNIETDADGLSTKTLTAGVIDNTDQFRAIKVKTWDGSSSTLDGLIGFESSDWRLIVEVGDGYSSDKNSIQLSLDKTVPTAHGMASPVFETEKIISLIEGNEEAGYSLSPSNLGISGESILLHNEYGYPTILDLPSDSERDIRIVFPNTDNLLEAEKYATVAYQEWVEANTIHLDGLTDKHIPYYGTSKAEEDSKGLVDSPLIVDEVDSGAKKIVRFSKTTRLGTFVNGKYALKDLTDVDPETIKTIKDYLELGAEATFLEFLTKENSVVNFQLDASEVKDGKVNVKVYHEDSIIDCGYWE